MTRFLRIVNLRGSTLAPTASLFAQGLVRLGRRPENDVAYHPQVDRAVSGFHAQVRMTPEGPLLCDQGSRGGTWVNGKRITAPTLLKPTDETRLGKRGPVLLIEVVAEADLPTTPESPRHRALEAMVADPAGLLPIAPPPGPHEPASPHDERPAGGWLRAVHVALQRSWARLVSIVHRR